MYNLNDKDLNNHNYKQRRSLLYNIKLIANNKDTSNLISLQNLEKGSFLAEEIFKVGI